LQSLPGNFELPGEGEAAVDPTIGYGLERRRRKMPETISTLPGFDAAKLEAFSTYAEDNPKDVVLDLEARSTWEGQGGRSLAKVGPWSRAGLRIEKPTREFTIQFGAWQEIEGAMGVEGAHDRIGPIETVLAAMCSCVKTPVCCSAYAPLTRRSRFYESWRWTSEWPAR
jgi:hypothetical protein